jgi:hypothetical protein
MKEETETFKSQRSTQDGSNSSDLRENSSSMRRVKLLMSQEAEIEKTITFKFGYSIRLQHNNGILFIKMR